MKNLALGPTAPDEMVRAVNETIHAELTAAGLTPLGILRSDGEVPAEWVAEVDTPHGPLRFERGWRYWVVRGKVPLKMAEHLYPNTTGIRAGGHGCNVPPAEEVRHYSTDGREYVTVDELQDFKNDRGRARWDRCAHEHVVVFSVPLGRAFVTSYHIDTQEGLNAFVAEMNAFYAMRRRSPLANLPYKPV